MTTKKKAVVIGAGLVGSLWAVFLARRGYHVEVFERRSDMRAKGYQGGRSINLAMSERGWAAVEKAGIRPQIENVAIPMPGRMMHAVSGETTFQPYGKEGQAIYSVSRGGLNLELLKIASEFPNVHFNFEHKCSDVNLEKEEAYFECLSTGETITVDAPLLFATDGAFSAVRYAMQRTDRFDYKQTYLEHGYKELSIPPHTDGSHKMPSNALHIWPRGNFMLIALPNADGSFTCTLFLPFEGPISFKQLTSVEAVNTFFQTYFPDTLALMPKLQDEFFANPTSSLITLQCQPWQWQGRMLLLGDSAHAIVPFYGQGMNAGFEDCTILDGMYDQFNGDWSKIIPAFSDQRKPSGDAIAELALRNFIEMRDLVADPKFLLRKKITAHLHEKYPQFKPSYSLVTFSNTPYHEALQEDDKQNTFFEAVLELDGIEQNWETNPALDALFMKWYPHTTN